MARSPSGSAGMERTEHFVVLPRDVVGSSRGRTRPLHFRSSAWMRVCPLPEAECLRLKAGSYHAGSWGSLPVRCGFVRRSARPPPAFEHLDDNHSPAAAGAWRAEVVRFVRGIIIRWRGDVQQFASEREAGLAGGAGEQAVVPNAAEAARQDMDEEAADELVDCERHHLLMVGAVAAIVLVAEGDVVLVEVNEAAVRDRDPVG